MFEHESRGHERQPKLVVDIEFESQDGLVKWRAKYDDGSVDPIWEDAEGLRAESRPDAIKAFRQAKLNELNPNRDHQIAA